MGKGEWVMDVLNKEGWGTGAGLGAPESSENIKRRRPPTKSSFVEFGTLYVSQLQNCCDGDVHLI